MDAPSHAGVRGEVVLLTDHSSREGSGAVLATAIEALTGHPPALLDARHFMTDSGAVRVDGGRLGFEMPDENRTVAPSVVIIYEIPPTRRRAFEGFQGLLRRHGVRSLGTDTQAWRAATEKDITVEVFAREGIPHMQTIGLTRPTPQEACSAFNRLGGNVWARPNVGMGGNDVFHITTRTRLLEASRYYAETEQNWLISRDAENFDSTGRRHQFRVVVLNGQILRVCEHIQADDDAPCNEGQGAVSTELSADELPAELAQLAVSATKALGLPFAGVDLVPESGGVVFEVNVHPTIAPGNSLATVAIPYVAAHLAAR
ncbi:RimK family alpha-L-glutamate ligase [Nocardia sp. NPDC049149]|uniref:ATP-grasp domain-containing protein n=1 Tax=Nocardia sp. NPDC049149 TaxID=3364315 RepID=UPI00372326B0